MEDVIGAGAVVARLAAEQVDDAGRLAMDVFEAGQNHLAGVLSETVGGINVRQAGLSDDIEFAARLDAVPVVGVAAGDPLVVTRG
jgi:phosphosulfolactate phosphohydrolase-like enzyme